MACAGAANGFCSKNMSVEASSAGYIGLELPAQATLPKGSEALLGEGVFLDRNDMS